MKKLVYFILLLISFKGFGQTVLTNNNHVTVTNKTMSGASNTFTNIPFSTGITGFQTLTISSPLTGTSFNGTAPISIGIGNAAADGSTKGAATFTTADFDATSGLISIDYTNGQAASGSLKGFLTSADWTTFNNKQAALNITANQIVYGNGVSGITSNSSFVWAANGIGTNINSFQVSGGNGGGVEFQQGGTTRGSIYNFGTDIYFSASSAQDIYVQAGGGKTRFGSNAAAPNSTVQIFGSLSENYVATAIDRTAAATDNVIEITADAKTVTLPTAVGIAGRLYTIKLTASAATGTVATTSSQTIDGSTTYSLDAQYRYVTVQSNGANWNIIANNAASGGGGVATLSGDLVDNTDPANPIVNLAGTLGGDRTVDLDGHSLNFLNVNGNNNALRITESGTSLNALDETGGGNDGFLSVFASPSEGGFQLDATFDDGATEATITGNAQSGSSTIEYTADTHTFNAGGNNFLILDGVQFQSILRAEDGDASSHLELLGDLIGNNVSFTLQADDDSQPAVEIVGDAIAQTMTLTSATTNISNLAGTGTRAVLASAAGDLSAPISDIRLKENIFNITDSVDVISLLKDDSKRGIYFNWRNPKMGTEKELGFTAQSFDDVKGMTGTMTNTGYKYLNYDRMPVILWEQNRLLLQRIEVLEKQVKELKK